MHSIHLRLRTSGDTASVTLRWAWPLARAGLDVRREGRADQVRRRVAGALVADAGAAPPRRGRRARGEPHHRAPAATSSAPAAPRSSPSGRSSRVGIDRAQVDGRRRRGLRPRGWPRLVGIDAGAYAKGVAAAGPQAFVEAIVYRRGERAARRWAGIDRIAGAVALPDELPLAPTKEFAAPILGTVGPVTAEMVEEHPDATAPATSRGSPGSRRATTSSCAARPALVVRRCRRRSGTAARAVPRRTPTPGEPLRPPSTRPRRPRPSSCWPGVGPASALVAMRPSHRRRSWPPPTARATAATTSRPTASSPRARRSRA